MNVERFRVRPGDRHALTRHRPDDTGHFSDKAKAVAHLAKGVERLAERQEALYARDSYALLLIFQGMDAAGKDGAIGHVMSGVNALGTEVHAFKQPSSEELAHDYLWRAVKVLPARGRVGIFNRSYYEETLVVRVHPNLLDTERLPPDRVTPRIWKERFEGINAFERHLTQSGTVIRKFFLNISRAEQRRRLLKRMDDPSKRWKVSAGDVAERERWPDYMRAYRDVLAATSTSLAPWYVIPSDHKWFARAAVADVIVQTLERLDLSLPPLSVAEQKARRLARRRLAGPGV